MKIKLPEHQVLNNLIKIPCHFGTDYEHRHD